MAAEAEISKTGAEGNKLSVMQELQADCFAGVWAHHAHRSRQILEEGDIEEALNAASAIGDDRMQRKARGYAISSGVSPSQPHAPASFWRMSAGGRAGLPFAVSATRVTRAENNVWSPRFTVWFSTIRAPVSRSVVVSTLSSY